MKAVVVIRKFDDFSRILQEKGFEVINLPLIETKRFDDLSELENQLTAIERYDGIFLTSSTAARILAEKFREKNVVFNGKIYVLGESSFQILKDEKLNLIFDENAHTALDFLKNLPAEDLQNKRFLFVRGEKSLRVVPEFLTRTAKVEETVVYETRAIKIAADRRAAISDKIAAGNVAAICFFSPSAASSFLEQFRGQILHQIRIATIGRTTTDFFTQRNITVDFVSSKARAKDFADELTDYLKRIN